MGKRKRRGRFLIAGGFLCVAAALALLLYNMWDDARAGIEVNQEKEALIAAVLPVAPEKKPVSTDTMQEEEEPAYESEPYREMRIEEVDGVDYVAILSIPTLNLELPVRSEWSYNGLKKSPCRYVGSAFMDDLVICAHNYSQHFGRLKDLEENSEILIVDMDGNLFRYRVVLIETLLPAEISEMVDSEYDLSLFTCTLGGRTRVTVRCRRVLEQNDPNEE